MVCGIVALLFPLEWALEAYPIPTVCIFVGLALGGLPSVTDKLRGKIKATNVIAFVIPLLAAFSLSFLPIGSEIDLFSLNFGGYVLLFLIGMVGSAALVVPGISGSMLLLIFGYYNPIVSMVTDNLLKGENVGLSISVLATAGAGVAVGFVLISVIMKKLLASCPRGTYFAILGFILGSIPTVFISTAKESGLAFSALMPNALYWVVSAGLLLLGIAGSLSLVIFSKKKFSSNK
jgi:putative membrane protein